ncbi:hypothetical protein [Bacillus sp. EAC]|nr:hypothetical protein [Bacillus sp. EAC]
MNVNDPNESNEVVKSEAELNFITQLPEIEEAIGIDEILKWLED